MYNLESQRWGNASPSEVPEMQSDSLSNVIPSDFDSHNSEEPRRPADEQPPQPPQEERQQQPPPPLDDWAEPQSPIREVSMELGDEHVDSQVKTYFVYAIL